MSQKVIISIDAMSGSNSPRSIIEGVAIALQQHPDLYLILFGDRNILTDLLKTKKINFERYSIVHTDTIISDHEQPIRALKVGAESSMRKAIDCVKDGLSQACVSSGNTGALMVMAKLVLKEIPGIKRPAIIGIIPNFTNGSVILDLGANAECDENNLLQFAIMGASFAKIMLDKPNPTVAILNVGIEQVKGRDLEKKSYDLIKQSGLNFIGYVEGHDITRGGIDVIVTDGFTGNVALKTAEGAAHLLFALLKKGFNKNLLSKIGGFLAKKALKDSFAHVDPNIKNGAMFIGINGIVIKSHGSASSAGFAHAISVAYDLIKRNINNSIIEDLSFMQDITEHKSKLVEKIKDTSAKLFGLK